jgi:hypothetical protein
MVLNDGSRAMCRSERAADNSPRAQFTGHAFSFTCQGKNSLGNTFTSDPDMCNWRRCSKCLKNTISGLNRRCYG